MKIAIYKIDKVLIKIFTFFGQNAGAPGYRENGGWGKNDRFLRKNLRNVYKFEVWSAAIGGGPAKSTLAQMPGSPISSSSIGA